MFFFCSLSRRRSSNLSMSMASRIVSQLPKLKELSLSSWMLNSKEERHLSYELTDKFWNESKIRLKFDRSLSNIECPYQNPTKQEYETSSDDDDSSDESRESIFAARNEHPGLHMDDDCKYPYIARDVVLYFTVIFSEALLIF